MDRKGEKGRKGGGGRGRQGGMEERKEDRREERKVKEGVEQGVEEGERMEGRESITLREGWERTAFLCCASILYLASVCVFNCSHSKLANSYFCWLAIHHFQRIT